MLTNRTIREFSRFILRRFNARKRRRGQFIDIIIDNDTVATYTIKNDEKIEIIAAEKTELSKKFEEVVRIHLAMRYRQPILLESSECIYKNCLPFLKINFFLWT